VKIICGRCKKEVRDISVLHEKCSTRFDYVSCSEGIVETDKEYLSGGAVELNIDCPDCGEIIVKIKDAPLIDVFSEDSRIISVNDICQKLVSKRLYEGIEWYGKGENIIGFQLEAGDVFYVREEY
jgi:hypothetical protein